MAVLNNSKYGWSGHDSTLTLTLLKSAKAPDAEADMGDHSFAYAVMPHQGSVQYSGVIQRAYEFNNPLRLEMLPSTSVPSGTSMSWARVVGDGIVLHTIKPAEDASGAVVLRLYESRGTRSSADIELTLPVASIVECDGLETPGNAVTFSSDGGVVTFTVKASPFSIRAFRLAFQ
ncbi:Glycosyl hydrolase family 38 C-terminal [Trinorchestia longiramus]|nr:Glycosyl hydrolase family 38 C-terminal [Trinorchestia longiramus]